MNNLYPYNSYRECVCSKTNNYNSRNGNDWGTIEGTIEKERPVHVPEFEEDSV